MVGISPRPHGLGASGFEHLDHLLRVAAMEVDGHLDRTFVNSALLQYRRGLRVAPAGCLPGGIVDPVELREQYGFFGTPHSCTTCSTADSAAQAGVR